MFSSRLKNYIKRHSCDHEYEITQGNIVERPFRAGAVRTCQQCGIAQIRLGIARRFDAFVNISRWSRPTDELDEEVVDMSLSLAPDDSAERVVREAIKRAVCDTNDPISLIRTILKYVCQKRSFAQRNTRRRSGEALKAG